MTKPNENWQERSYEAFTPNVKLDCNNPQEGFSGPIVYNMLASSKDGNQSSYGMTEGGLFHIYNDQCIEIVGGKKVGGCLLYTSPSPRDTLLSRMPSSA